MVGYIPVQIRACFWKTGKIVLTYLLKLWPVRRCGARCPRHVLVWAVVFPYSISAISMKLKCDYDKNIIFRNAILYTHCLLQTLVRHVSFSHATQWATPTAAGAIKNFLSNLAVAVDINWLKFEKPDLIKLIKWSDSGTIQKRVKSINKYR